MLVHACACQPHINQTRCSRPAAILLHHLHLYRAPSTQNTHTIFVSAVYNHHIILFARSITTFVLIALQRISLSVYVYIYIYTIMCV